MSSLFFAASSTFEVVLRLALAFVALYLAGFVTYPEASWTKFERALNGLLLATAAIYTISVGRPGPYIGSSCLALLVAAGAFRYSGRALSKDTALLTRHPRNTGLWILGLLTLLWLLVRAEWPRIIPMSTDPQLHAWFLEQTLRSGGIPHNQGLVGPEPLNYPAGLSVLGFVFAKLCGGLRALDVAPLLGVIAVFGVMAHLYESAPSRLKGAARALGLFAFAWAVQYPTRDQAGFGRTVLLPFAVYAFYRARTLPKDRASYVTLLSLLAILSILINLIVFPFFGLPLAWLAFRQNSLGAKVANGAHALSIAFAAGWVALCADPYFEALLHGTLRSPVQEYGTPAKVWQVSLVGALGELGDALTNPMPYLREFFGVGLGHRGALAVLVVLLVLSALQASARRRLSSFTRNAALWLAFGFLISVFALLFRGADNVNAGLLIKRYLPIFYCFLFEVVLFVELFGTATAPPTLSRARRSAVRGVEALLLGFLFFSSLAWTIKKASFMREPLNPSMEVAVRAANELWQRNPAAKILVPNEVVDLGFETWLFPVGQSRVVAYLPNSNPAFFFFQGSRDFSIQSYLEHYCRRFDPAWMREHNITHVIRAPGDHVSCTRLAPVAAYSLESAGI